MKIGVVSAHYLPGIGYQEVHLARAFARLAHTVKVFTTTAGISLGGKLGKPGYEAGLTTDPKLNFEVLRLSSYSFKSKAYSSALKRSVLEFGPDILIVLGVAKIFPLPLLSADIRKKTKIVSLYGDAQEYLERNTLNQKIRSSFFEMGYTFIKKPLYKKAVRYCDKIILNIPETDAYFRSFLPATLKPMYESKKLMLNLGFDPDEYYFDETDRKRKREELRINEDEIVLITSTRINRRKNLEQIIELVSKLNTEGKKIRYILIGFLKDGYEKELKAFIGKQPNPENFLCFPFLSAAEIRKLYCAADAGIWLKAAISIQEAMGTGLRVILENKPSVNHLLKSKQSGWYYESTNRAATIENAVVEIGEEPIDRSKNASLNAQSLSYTEIAKKIINSLNIPQP